jgi:hypothetical protein
VSARGVATWCALCLEPCTDSGARTCECAGGGHVRATLPSSSNLALVAALAALSGDPVFRSAVRRAAFVVRGGAA